MSLLKVATIEEAEGEVKEIFQEIEATFGMLPEGISLWSLNPKALKFQWESIKEVFSKDEDTQKMHTIIRYLVSEKNHCEYCVGLNGGMLMNMFGMSEEELKALGNDLASANLTPKNQALLELAMSAIVEPKAVSSDKLQELREMGISEEEMFNVVLSASQMLVVNTLFDTFDVE